MGLHLGVGPGVSQGEGGGRGSKQGGGACEGGFADRGQVGEVVADRGRGKGRLGGQLAARVPVRVCGW